LHRCFVLWKCPTNVFSGLSDKIQFYAIEFSAELQLSSQCFAVFTLVGKRYYGSIKQTREKDRETMEREIQENVGKINRYGRWTKN
jgi:hypothetical protein